MFISFVKKIGYELAYIFSKILKKVTKQKKKESPRVASIVNEVKNTNALSCL